MIAETDVIVMVKLTKRQVASLLHMINSVMFPGSEAEQVVQLKESLRKAIEPTREGGG